MYGPNDSDSCNQPDRPGRKVRFTIDGREFTTSQTVQTAASLLQLAGLNAEGYDLGELHGNRPDPKRYRDEQKVHIQDGDRFVSIRESATVA